MVLLRRLAFAALSSTALACSPAPVGPADAGTCTAACDAGKAAACGSPKAGAVSLSKLSVQSTSDSTLTLIPAFAPGIYDYYVQCSEGPNPLTVSMTASSGAAASLALESPGGSTQPAKAGSTLSVEEGQAIVATVTAGKSSQDYWVRCVPHDFPEMQWTPHENGCSRPPGYYLIGTMSLPPNKGPYAIVLDSNGVPVWYRENLRGGVFDVETLIPGAISFAPYWQVDHLGGATTSPVVDPYDGGPPPPQCAEPQTTGSPDDHELRILPNGHYLAIQSPSVTGIDLTGLTLPDSPPHGPNETILACEIQEFDGTGKVYWEWTATDHFDPAQVMVLKGNGDLSHEIGCAGPYVEPFHCNSIDVDTSNGDPNNGNLLISARDMSSVFYIDKKTKKVLWKMGGADSSKDNAVYVPVPAAHPFAGQHDARFLPGWKQTCSGFTGQISLFDDESYTTNPARGAVYDVNVDLGASGCSGGATTGATQVWEYKSWFNHGVPSSVTGGFRITADGSRIIGWGQSQPSGSVPWVLFTEVDEKGNDLLDLVCPDGSSSYRAVKVPLRAFELGVLRRASGTSG